jgi:hypothetical protein
MCLQGFPTKAQVTKTIGGIEVEMSAKSRQTWGLPRYPSFPSFPTRIHVTHNLSYTKRPTIQARGQLQNRISMPDMSDFPTLNKLKSSILDKLKKHWRIDSGTTCLQALTTQPRERAWQDGT